jgi:hypothetical protein
MTTHHTLDAISLPRGMVWVDELDWVPVETSTEYSITGALLVQSSERLSGRPITLQGEESAGWIRRDVLLSIRAAASVPGDVLALTLADGRTFSVMFAPGNPITARPIARPELPPNTHPYVATVRLIEV